MLVRGGATRKPAVLRHLADGSYLSRLAGRPVRISEADLAVRGADGTCVADRYRLLTTLLDPGPVPGAQHVPGEQGVAQRIRCASSARPPAPRIPRRSGDPALPLALPRICVAKRTFPLA